MEESITVEVWQAVEVFDDGEVRYNVYWSLDGEQWGLVYWRSKRDKFANFGGCWEAAVEGIDEYSHTMAQTWYDCVEDSILSNLVDFDNDPSTLLSRIEVVDGDWKQAENTAWETAVMVIGGYSSPTGEPYYCPRK